MPTRIFVYPFGNRFETNNRCVIVRDRQGMGIRIAQIIPGTACQCQNDGFILFVRIVFNNRDRDIHRGFPGRHGNGPFILNTIVLSLDCRTAIPCIIQDEIRLRRRINVDRDIVCTRIFIRP